MAVMLALKKRTVDELAALSRMSRKRIKDIRAAPGWTGKRKHFWHYARHHGADLAVGLAGPEPVSLSDARRCVRAPSSGRVLACKKFDQLLLLVSQQAQKLCNETLWKLRQHGSLSG